MTSLIFTISGCNKEIEAIENYYPEDVVDLYENNQEIEPSEPSPLPDETMPHIESPTTVVPSLPTSVPNDSLSATENTYQYNEDELSRRGIIEGDIYYGDIALSRIFTEPFIDVLGEPWGSRDSRFFFYDNFEITWFGWGDDLKVAHTLNIWPPNLHLLELNGFNLAMNRLDVIETFGNPTEYYAVQSFNVQEACTIIYYVMSPIKKYALVFRFYNSDDLTEISNIAIQSH